MTTQRSSPLTPPEAVRQAQTRHRRQVVAQILLPVTVGAVLLLALGVAVAWDPQTAAQGGSTATIFFAVLGMLVGLPWLAVVALGLVLAFKAPAAVRRTTRDAHRRLAQVDRRVRRWSDRLAAPWLRVAGWRAGATRLFQRIFSRER